jgi:XTP/dITP diphosphohydrolase/tetrapyrrole methylase family protein/MazG family protein
MAGMSAIEELKKTMARLRGPDGCPWDQDQTHQSISRCLIEECAELLETIDRLDMDHMREELGDVLLQVVFHARMAEEAGFFSFEDVAAGINEKLIRRHPHVFGEVKLQDSAEVLKQWEEIKAREKGNSQPDVRKLKELPSSLPALLYAWDVVKQLQRKELLAELPGADEAVKLAEGLDEERAGELLFEISAACRLAGIDPESALRRHVGRLIVQIEKESR